MRIASNHIVTLQPNEIFVFGSNLEGQHAGGAAYLAYKRFGAIWGQGVGLQGQSYATRLCRGVETIKPYVSSLSDLPKSIRLRLSLLSEIGLRDAGLQSDVIAPLFEQAKEVENIYLPQNDFGKY